LTTALGKYREEYKFLIEIGPTLDLEFKQVY